MGIDVPAFGRRVDRPEDFAAERGELFSVDDGFALSTGTTNRTDIHQNTSGTRQFLLLANLTQRIEGIFDAQSPVRLGFRVQTPSRNVQFRILSEGEPLTETLPSLPIRPDDVITLRLDNESSSKIIVDASFAIRQG